MPKAEKRSRQLPGWDSPIALAPGESLTLDAPLHAEWRRKTRVFREFRGNVLVGGFEIEFQLDAVISEALFPGLEDPAAKPTDIVPLTIETAKVLKNLFDELILKNSTLAQISFAFKIDLLRRLIPEIPILTRHAPKKLADTLDKFRRIRNRFAHYPVEFKAIGPAPHVGFNAYLACRDKTILLDDEFIKGCSELSRSALAGLQDLLQNLRASLARRPVAAPITRALSPWKLSISERRAIWRRKRHPKAKMSAERGKC